MRELRLDQVFVRRRGDRLELLLVVETLAGARERERLLLPTADPGAAMRQAARHRARRGVVVAAGVRLRVERNGTLRDDRELASLLHGAYERELDR